MPRFFQTIFPPTSYDISTLRISDFGFNELNDPQPIPAGKDHSSLIESDVPIVVQHTRLDSRQAENALMTTIAFADPGSGAA